ncbi:unnamed protein product [Hyaloperonospora brassicae]|uniref:Transmembrane protein n=1 Tax=Hyaloperonospora brassicae TaxID=162125 RepID=A0AAV0TI51_HYABA|nr:unnamed protein product [Hyaloperonospora brassicae]
MRLTPHGEDFQNYYSPSFPNYNNDAELPPHATRGFESLAPAEIGAGRSVHDVDLYGSLRKGDPVKFFSKDCAGVVAATFASAFSADCLNNVIDPMLSKHFFFSVNELEASRRLIAMPSASCFFFGLLSDCYPIMGFRRKAYLIVSLVLTVFSYLILSALNMYGESLEKGTASTGLAGGMILFSSLAGIGNMVTFMCVHTRVIELAQREPLVMRGAIVATYSIFRFAVSAATSAFAYVVRSNVTYHSTELIGFGLVIALTIPLVWKAWLEKYYSLSTSMKIRGQILWRVMQQKAVWSILLFLCISTLFSSIKFRDHELIVSYWAGASSDNIYLLQTLSYAAMILMIIVWRYFCMNRPWRALFAMSTVLLVVSKGIQATCVTLDIFRNRYFYRAMNLFPSMAVGISWLSSIVPLTEITQEGSEGAMVGLMTSLYYSVIIFVQTNTTGLFKGANFYENNEAGSDSPEARLIVLKTIFICYGINALALIGIFFLPRQKLDTQQIRSYGGYTKCASAAILAFVVVLFSYSLVVTILTLVPSTSCLGIAGGEGC